MIRDLVEVAIKLVKEEETQRIHAKATKRAEDRIVKLVIEQYGPKQATNQYFAVDPDGSASRHGVQVSGEAREVLRLLRNGELDHLEITTELAAPSQTPAFEVVGAAGMEDMMAGLKDALSNLQGSFGGPPQKREQKMLLPEAMAAVLNEESDSLIDMDRVQSLALDRAQQEGIIFLDEIDKIALTGGRGGGQGPDVSRGVQRDLLPIVEGTTVSTKYGMVKTDHILFHCCGCIPRNKSE